MKKVILITFIMIFLVSSIVMAHTPQNLEVNYNNQNHILNVEIVHTVGGENSQHYIDNIVVTYKDSKLINQIPGKQLNDKESFMYYMPGLKKGDKINVKVFCSIQGNLNVDYTVPEKNKSN